MPKKDHEDLPKEVLEALKAGRIEASNLTTIRYVIEKYGLEKGLEALKYFEDKKYLEPYFENYGLGFKFKQFTYHPDLPQTEKAKILTALRQAIAIVELTYERRQSDDS